MVPKLVSLRDRWYALWERCDVPSPPDVFTELARHYSAPGRFYHNLAHVEDCLALFEQTKTLAGHPREVELAIWFHDAVYYPHRSDNEQQSAVWAASVIQRAGLEAEFATRVSRCILATRHSDQVTAPDAQLMVDVDLSILGREPDVFWRYEENIRKEYARVPAERFRQKRIEILSGFLSRPTLYHHTEFRNKFEAQARSNLKKAVTRLSGNAAVGSQE